MAAKHYLSLALAEPADAGTVLVVRRGDGYRVIVRDDGSGASHGRRWFDAADADGPMTWRAALEYADEVFPLGTPLATVPS
ncbi:hypothetical protein [Streptosporangium canum]|uniref:hypothetical protein n=1 Tax=Streptosporangium canum TaxID=324952 RepID=UPI00378D1F2F